MSCGCHRRKVGKRMAVENGLGQITKIKPGTRFTRWTVIRFDGIKDTYSHYLCRCDCGTVRSVNTRSLTTGNSQSCGCYHKEVSAEHARKYFTKHGLCKEPWYIRFLKHRRYHSDRHWTAEMEALLFQLQPRCVVCGSSDKLEIDHVSPNIIGGSLEPGNAVVLCRSCNAIKHDKPTSKLSKDWRDKIESAARQFLDAWNSR